MYSIYEIYIQIIPYRNIFYKIFINKKYIRAIQYIIIRVIILIYFYKYVNVVLNYYFYLRVLFFVLIFALSNEQNGKLK